jgi:hypothetical protein
VSTRARGEAVPGPEPCRICPASLDRLEGHEGECQGPTELRGIISGVRGITEGLGRRARARQVRTPDRALATIEKLSTLDLEPIGVTVYVWPEARGRVTGFFVGCEDCGAMPFLAPSKAAGHLAAARHVKAEHRSKGTVVLRDRRLVSRVGA